MAAICTAPSLQGAIAESLIDYVDCQSKALGEIGFQTLAAPGSSVGLMLVGLLTIFIALIGFRLLLGDTPTLRRIVLDVIRVGVVLMLASSWAAYHVLVYDIATLAPIELAAEISRPLGLPGSDGSLITQLQDTADLLNRVSGSPTASTTFLVSTLGALLATRAVTGLLLALGPLVATFLLFNATRGLFEGWVRALVAMALGTFTTLVLLGLELSVLQPIVGELAAAQSANQFMAHGMEWPPAIAALFGLVIIAGLIAAFKIASGFRLSWGRDLSVISHTASGRRAFASESIAPGSAISRMTDGQPRAAAIGEALLASMRRETLTIGPAATTATGRRDTPLADRSWQAVAVQPLGQSQRRVVRSRVSARVRKRDNAQ